MLALVDQLVAIASIYVAVEIPCGTFKKPLSVFELHTQSQQ